MALNNELKLKRDLKSVTHELVGLNRQLATKMIVLASQTGDVSPLFQAVDALKAAQEIYPADGAPLENAKIHQSLADSLLRLGRANGDMSAVKTSIGVYRSAISLASMLGDETMRKALKKNYMKARNIVNQDTHGPNLAGVA